MCKRTDVVVVDIFIYFKRESTQVHQIFASDKASDHHGNRGPYTLCQSCPVSNTLASCDPHGRSTPVFVLITTLSFSLALLTCGVTRSRDFNCLPPLLLRRKNCPINARNSRGISSQSKNWNSRQEISIYQRLMAVDV